MATAKVPPGLARTVAKLQLRKAKARACADLHKERAACQEMIDRLSGSAATMEMQRDEWRDMAQIAERTGDQKQQMQAHRRIVDLSIELINSGKSFLAADLDRCLESSDAYVRLASELGDDVEWQRAMVTKARLYGCSAPAAEEVDQRGSHYRQADSLYRKALKAVDKVAATVGPREAAEMRCICLFNMIFVAQQLDGEETESRVQDILDRLEEVSVAGKLLKWILKVHLERVRIHLAEGHLQESSIRLEKARDVLKKCDREVHDENLSDFLLLQAKLKLRQRNFQEAKVSLEKIVSPYDDEVSNLKRGVRKLVRSVKKLEGLSRHEGERQKLLEKLGDLTSKLQLSEIAAKYYQESLACQEQEKLTNDEMADLYFSLASCLEEAGKLQEAHYAFKSELVLRKHKATENEEAVDNAVTSWVRMIKILTRLSKPFEVVEKELREALAFVRKRNVPSLEVQLLRFLAHLQNAQLLHAEADGCLSLANSIVEEKAIDENDLKDFQEDDADEEVGVFSSDSEVDDHEESETRSKRKRGPVMRRNDKGETQLHLKCKSEGNVDAIKRLLASGTPVDDTDKFDYTPLLEACNYGHLEYVKVLHEAGADLNWVGGKSDRVSALIDACSGGHVDIAQYLLQHGANVFHQDRDGWTARDHMSHFLRANEDDMREEDVAKAKSILRDMDKAIKARETSGQAVYILEKKACSSALSVDGDLNQAPVIEDVGERPSRRPRQERTETAQLHDEPRDRMKRRRLSKAPLSKGARDYRKVMSAFRRRDIAGGNDLDSEEEGPTEGGRSCETMFTRTAPQSPPEASAAQRQRSHSPVAAEELPDLDADETDRVDTIDIADDLGTSTPATMERSGECLPQSSKSQPALAQFANTGLFTVVVEGKRMAIPLDLGGGESGVTKVRRLTEIAAERYSVDAASGAKPILRLSTPDGAELHPDDPVAALVTAGGNNLVATVVGWHLPPIGERYAEACKRASSPLLVDVAARMAESERTGSLMLKCALGTERARPVFRALVRAESIVELLLPANRLLDAGVKELANALPTMTNLARLDLSTNGLTAVSVGILIECAESGGEKSLTNLRHLSFAFNYLGNDSAKDLAKLAECLTLHSLDLSSCGLSQPSGERMKHCSSIVKNFTIAFNDLKV